MTIVFTMTARMIATVGFCLVLLCAVLFLLGVQIGANYVHATGRIGAPAVSVSMPAVGALARPGDSPVAPGLEVGDSEASSSPSSGASQP